MLRAVIIDDEQRSRLSLQTLLMQYCAGVDVVGMAEGVQSGTKCIEQHNPDLVLLDVKMQDGTGFDLLKRIAKPTFQLIFTTAFNEYAIKAFKFSAVDYLLKPIDVAELEAAIQRVHTQRASQAQDDQYDPLIKNLLSFNQTDPRITVSTEHTLEILPVAEIVRMESDGPYTHFVMADGRNVVSSKHLKHYDMMMEEYHFLRIHNSHVVNLKYVKRYYKGDGGIVELLNGDKIPISRRRKEPFLEKYSPR